MWDCISIMLGMDSSSKDAFVSRRQQMIFVTKLIKLLDTDLLPCGSKTGQTTILPDRIVTKTGS